MKKYLIMTLLIAAPIAAAAAETADADAQVADLERMCEMNAEARTARHAEKTLYERLGKEKGIEALTAELVRLHRANPAISHIFEGTSDEVTIRRVSDFMISGFGGPVVYKDRPTLPDAHRHMKLTNADFMVAGADMIQAMQNLGHGQEEIDEVVCALVGLRPMVVLSE